MGSASLGSTVSHFFLKIRGCLALRAMFPLKAFHANEGFRISVAAVKRHDWAILQRFVEHNYVKLAFT